MPELSTDGDRPRKSGVPMIFAIMTLVFIALFGSTGGEMPPFVVTAGIIAIFVYVLTLSDIRIGMAVMIVSIGFSPEFELGGTGNLRLEDLLVPILLMAWATRMVERRDTVETSPLRAPILAYLFVATISSLKGISFGDVDARRCLLQFGKTVEYFLMMVIMANNIRSLREAKVFAYIMVIVATTTGIFGIRQHMIGEEAFASTRVTGPYGESSNVLGGYFIFHLSIAIGMCLFAETIRTQLFLLAAALALFFPFLYTFSRTSYVALLVGLTTIGVLKSRRLLIVLGGILVLLPFIVSVDVINRASTILDLFGPRPPSSWNARMSGWTTFGNTVFTNPLFGRGIGVAPMLIDNEYVKQVVDTGLIGLILFIVIIGIMARMAFEVMAMAAKDAQVFGFACGYLAGLVCLSVHALGATSFTTIRTMEPLMVATGILCAIHANYKTWMQAEVPSEDLRYIPTRHRRRMRPLAAR